MGTLLTETRRDILILVGLLLLSRIPGLLFGYGYAYNSDELEMTYSVLDRWLGAPSTSLAWPGSTLQLFSLPGVGALYAAQSFPSISPSSFVTYLSQAYRAPWSELTVLRCVGILVSSVGLASLYLPFRKVLEQRWLAWVGVAFTATVPLLWQYTHMGTGDSLSLGFFCLSIAALSTESNSRFAWSGVWMGLAVASKITIVLGLPFVGLLVLRQSTWRRPSWVVLFGLGLAVGFLFGCPYLWIDPVRFLKSIVGNASRAGTPMGLLGAMWSFFSVLTIPVMCAALLGFWGMWRSKAWAYLIAAVGTFLILMVLFSRSGVVYSRYYLSLVPITGFLFAFAMQTIHQWLQHKPSSTTRIVLGSVLGLVLLSNVALYGRVMMSHASKKSAIYKLLAELDKHHAKTMLLPKTLLTYVAHRITQTSLQQTSVRAKKAFHGETYHQFLRNAGLPQNVTKLLGHNFSEDEQVFYQRVQLMAHTSVKQGWNVRFYAPPAAALRFGLLSEAEALKRWKQNSQEPFVIWGASSAEPKEKPQSFARLRLYVGVQAK